MNTLYSERFIVATMAFIGFLYGVLFQSYTPILPYLASHYQLSDQAVGAIIGFFALSAVLVSIPAGILADKLPVKILLLGSAIVVLLGVLLNTLLATYSGLLAGRFVAGLGGAILITLVPKFLAQTIAPERLDQAVSIYNQVLTGGFVLGVFIGQGAFSLLGLTGLQWLLVTLTAIMVVSLIKLPNPQLQKHNPLTAKQQRFTRPNRAAMLLALVFAFHGMSNMQLLTFTPVDLAAQGENKSTIAWIVALFYIPSTLITVWFCRPLTSFSRQKWTAWICQTTVLLMILLLAFYPAFWTVSIIAGLALVGIIPVLYLLTNLLVPQSQFGIVYGLYTTAYTGGVFLGGQLVGASRDAFDSTTGYLVMASFALLGTIIIALIPNKIKKET